MLGLLLLYLMWLVIIELFASDLHFGSDVANIISFLNIALRLNPWWLPENHIGVAMRGERGEACHPRLYYFH